MNSDVVSQKKRVWSNFRAMGLVQASNYLLPLVFLPYLARVVGVDNFGLIALSLSLTLYFSALVEYGFDYSAVRVVAQIQGDIVQLRKLFYEVLACKVFLLGVSFAIYVLVISTFSAFAEYKEYLLASFLIVPLKMLMHEWYLQGIEKMRHLSMLHFITKLIYAISIFIFVKDEKDILLVPLLNALAFLVSVSFANYLIYKQQIYSKFFIPSLAEIYARLKSGWNIFLTQLAPNFYNSFSIVLLGVVAPLGVVGQLDAARKLTTIFEQFATLLSRAFYPFLARNISFHKWYLFVVTSAAILVLIIVSFAAEVIILLLFGEAYVIAAKYDPALGFAMVFAVVYQAFATNFLLLVGRDSIVRNITLGASVLGFVMALYLVPRYEAWGVIGVLLITRFLMAAFSL